MEISNQHITEELIDTEEQVVNENVLILFNDDVNSFEHVIDLLIKVCEHNSIQAEQCATIVHCNGKCSIKNGTMKELTAIGETLAHYGLTVEIN